MTQLFPIFFLCDFSIFTNLIYLFIFKIIIKLIMTLSRFDHGPISKTLNLSLLRFIERSGFQNYGLHLTSLQKKWTIVAGQNSRYMWPIAVGVIAAVPPANLALL